MPNARPGDPGRAFASVSSDHLVMVTVVFAELALMLGLAT